METSSVGSLCRRVAAASRRERLAVHRETNDAAVPGLPNPLHWAAWIALLGLLISFWRHPFWTIVVAGGLGTYLYRAHPQFVAKLIAELRDPNPVQTNWTCRACGADNPSEVRECVSCRAVSTWQCEVCGTDNPEGINVCLRCSAPVRDPRDSGGLL